MKSKIILEDISRILENKDIPWESLRSKNVLITGASGMLPAYVVDTLLVLNRTMFANNKIQISVLIRNLDTLKERFLFHSNFDDLHIISSDISHTTNFDFEYDYIFHAASLASPKFYGVDPVEF